MVQILISRLQPFFIHDDSVCFLPIAPWLYVSKVQQSSIPRWRTFLSFLIEYIIISLKTEKFNDAKFVVTDGTGGYDNLRYR